MAVVIAYSGDVSVFRVNLLDGKKRRRDDAEFSRLQAASRRALKAGRVVGLLYRAQWADSYAYYRVAKESPLTLEHIPYGDAWRLPAAYERGIELDDVRRAAEFDANLYEHFKAVARKPKGTKPT